MEEGASKGEFLSVKNSFEKEDENLDPRVMEELEKQAWAELCQAQQSLSLDIDTN